MARVEFDLDEMAALAESLRRQGDQLLEGPISAVAREATALPAVEQRLARYGIRLGPSADAVERSRGPAAQMANALSDLGLTLSSLRNVLNDIERHAEANAGQLFKDVGDTRVQMLQRGILENPQAIPLARLRSQIDWRLPADPAQAAGAVRLWLQSEVPDAATRAWIVENSPDVARLLAENVDEGDRAVRELRAVMSEQGTRPFAYFLGLSPERRQWLAVAYPSLIGNLDGAPSDMRGMANRVNLVAYREKLFDDLARSQLQGYRVPARDETSLSLRIRAIDSLLDTEAGNRVLAFDRPDAITQMTVVVDDSTPSKIAWMRLMSELAQQAGSQQGYSQAMLEELNRLKDSDDPAVARFGRETAHDLSTTGRIDPGKAADLLGKAEYPLLILTAVLDAGERIEAGEKPPEAVFQAIGKSGTSAAAGTAGTYLCMATGPGMVPCTLIGIGAGLAGERLWQLNQDNIEYATSPAPGDDGTNEIPVVALPPTTPYEPGKYFNPVPKPSPLRQGYPYTPTP